ncbi:MAG: lytic murein transglycosylase B, partial [Burkholderiaceae bacterium]|nr:lytic murein transglycosylase B [Burkholderiaceae bacterium]
MTSKTFSMLLACALCAVAATASGATTHARKSKKAVGTQPRAIKATAPRPASAGQPYASREDAMRYADDVAVRRDLDRDWVRQAIAQARHLPVVSRLMLPAPSGVPKNWRVYRSRFIDPVRIAA